MPQSQRIKLRIGFGGGRSRHRIDEAVDNGADISCFVDSYHPEAVVGQMDVELLLVLRRAEIPRRAEVRREAAIDTQFIHDHACPREKSTLKCSINCEPRKSEITSTLDLSRKISLKFKRRRKIENTARLISEEDENAMCSQCE